MNKRFYDNEKLLAKIIERKKITNIRVEFDGSGDSGAIDYVYCQFEDSTDEKKNNIDKIEVMVWRAGGSEFNKETRKWEDKEPEFKLTNLGQFLADHVEDALSSTGVDWYNNDGGYGTWEWAPSTGVIFNVYTRHTESDLAHSEDRKLGSTEDDEVEEDFL